MAFQADFADLWEEVMEKLTGWVEGFLILGPQKTFLAARSRAIKAVKTAFDENGLTIPFPIRTLDFGVVGGETLAEHLREMKEEKTD